MNDLQRQRGATLIEVLVALIILAVGLLGLAGLQASSIRGNQSSYYRSQATILAYDMSDRMRANRTAAKAGSYNISSFPTSSSSNSVSGTQAQKDQAEWLNYLASLLPEGTGRITTSGNIVTISVRWNDARGTVGSQDDSSASTQTFDYRTRL